jgi:hypothetical protein
MKMSFNVLRKDKEILLFPLISLIITVLIMISFFSSFYFFLGLENMTSIFMYVIFFFVYVFLYIIVLFFNTAIIGCATIRLNGGNPTVSDGLHIAGKNISKILGWGIIGAIIGVILKTIQQKAGIAGKIVSFAAGLAWTYATFFIIPVLIYEDIGVFKSIKRSGQIFKSTWGETITGTFGFGIIFMLLGFLGVFFLIAGGALGGFTGFIIGLIAAVIYWLIIGIVATATNGIYVAALYQYATKDKLPSAFDSTAIPQPINPRKY